MNSGIVVLQDDIEMISTNQYANTSNQLFQAITNQYANTSKPIVSSNYNTLKMPRSTIRNPHPGNTRIALSDGLNRMDSPKRLEMSTKSNTISRFVIVEHRKSIKHEMSWSTSLFSFKNGRNEFIT